MSSLFPEQSAPDRVGTCLLDTAGQITWVDENWRRTGCCAAWRPLSEQDNYLTAAKLAPPLAVEARGVDGQQTDSLFEQMRSVLKGEKASLDGTLQLSEGTLRIHAERLPGPDHRLLVVHDRCPSKKEPVDDSTTDVRTTDDIEHALRDQQLRLELAARVSNVGFWDWDCRTQQVAYSDEWKAQIGYEPDEIGNDFSEWADRVHPDEFESVMQTVQDHIAGKTLSYTREFRFRHKNGSYRWIYVRGEVVRDANGAAVRLVGCHLDITERKRAEQEREELAQRLNQMQRLESIGTLAGGIAHDFNNILSIISGNAQLCLDQPCNEPMHEMLKDILATGERARALVRQILTFSRNESPRRQRVPLEPVVREATGMLRSTIPASVAIETHVDRNTPDVSGDPSQLHQVLVNLGTNAWHAMEERPGKITIRAFATGGGAEREPHNATIEVRDNGAGMTAATRQRVFEPFFTTKPSGKGTGLGLSVVHGIVMGHDGTIEVQSALGEGSAFRITLPAAGPAIAENPATARHTTTGGRVLLLDDEPLLLRTLTRGLKHHGFEIAAFDNAEAALAELSTAPASFDALVTDYDMPDTNGAAVARRARSIRADLPILLCSGFLTDEAAAAAKQDGPYCALSKPVHAHDLAQKIAELVGRFKS